MPAKRGLKICVDALPMLAPNSGGRYLRNLVKNLLRLNSGEEYILSLRSGPFGRARLPDFEAEKGVSIQSIRLPNRLLEYAWTHNDWCVPFSKKLFGTPDVYFASLPYFSPVLAGVPVVQVIFDTYILDMPHYAGLKEKHSYEKRFANVATRSGAIIAISESTKNDFCSIFPVKPDLVTVIPLAADRELFRPIPEETAAVRVLERFGIKGRYILYVGEGGYHKNLGRLLGAFRKLKTAGGIPHKLVLCGACHDGFIKREALGCGLGAEVIFTGPVADSDLVCLYSGADLLALVSLREGFGLPLVEAMNCGTPVLCSNVSAMPEVAGGAGILVNPLEEGEIADAIVRVLSDENVRRELRRKALERAGAFSWEETARKTLEVIKRMAG